MVNRLFFLFISIPFLFSSCQSNKEPEYSIEGIWESIGYGKILKIEAKDYSIFDITKVSCLPGQQGKVATFGEGIKIQNDTLSITSGTSIYQYVRISKLPDLCIEEIAEKRRIDPLYNFEVFAQTIKEHYAYFELNGINWDSLYDSSKRKITSETTNVELYLALEELLTSLNDNHGYIEPSDEVYEQIEKLEAAVQQNKDAEQLKEYGDFQIAQMVADTFLNENMTEDSWLIKWGKMKNNTGYIQVKAMWLFAELNLSDSLIKQNGFVDTYVDAFTKLTETEYIQEEVKGVSKIMDRVIEDLLDTEYVILDVRFNGGGQDAVGLEILRRFNDMEIQVATKRARFNNGYTKKTPISIGLSENPYKNPVYLLTSQQSASATDFMALASLEIEEISRIGSHTSGALSDALEKNLPNGWYFSISNLVYEDNNGKCYENIGVPVDFELNYPNDRQTFFRNVADNLEEDKRNILQAIEELRAK